MNDHNVIPPQLAPIQSQHILQQPIQPFQPPNILQPIQPIIINQSSNIVFENNPNIKMTYTDIVSNFEFKKLITRICGSKLEKCLVKEEINETEKNIKKYRFME